MMNIKRQLVMLTVAALLVMLAATPVSAALPDTIAQVEGTVIVVGDLAGDYAGAFNGGTATDQITTIGLAAGSARQSDKIDFGANRAMFYSMRSGIEFDVAPTSGGTVDHYLCFSTSGTAGTDNSGGTSGSDAAYTGTAGDSLDDSIKQCKFVGSLVATADASTVVQYQQIGVFTTPSRYANLVLDNNASQAFEAVDDIEIGVLITPLESRIQD